MIPPTRPPTRPWNSALLGLLLMANAAVLWAMRPGTADIEADRALATLADFPETLGTWRLVETGQFDVSVAELLRSDRLFRGRYRCSRTGDCVEVALIVGPTEPTAAHAPEVCLGAYAYRPVGHRRELAIGGSRRPRFWTVAMAGHTIGHPPLQVTYGWNAGNGWNAPQWPRCHYALEPRLCKLQLVSVGHGESQSATHRRFLAALVAAHSPSS